MTAFSFAKRLRAGETGYCAWCALGMPIIAEVAAREGFAAVGIDQQHGQWDMTATFAGISAVRGAGAAALVRVPLGDFAVASRALDAGAEGIIAPMINTVADAKAFVAAAKYPPLGDRSWGPNRAMMLQGKTGGAGYLAEANEGTLTLAMIETKTALDNVEAIAATPGVDALFIGPSDLSITLTSGKTLDPHSAEVEKAVERIADAAKKAGKIPGVYCRDAARAKEMAKRGFRFIAIGSDLAYLRDGLGAQLKPLKA